MDKTKYTGKFLYVYSDIFFTKGHRRTMMCDFKKKMWQFIPNEYFELTQLFKRHTIDAIEAINKVEPASLYEFIEFLIADKCAQVVDQIDFFPDIDLKWDTSHPIENSIIDIDQYSKHDYVKIANELQVLFCRNIQFRSFSCIALAETARIIDVFKCKDFESLDFILKYSDSISAEDYLELARKNPSVSFIVHSAPENLFFESKLKDIYPIVGYVQYIQQNISSANCCGIINKEGFVFPRFPRDFIEGVVRNRCLNGKISISVCGDIKNCPSMKESYGNIQTDSLIEVIQKKEFRDYWFITKDKISTCRDCEYRHICNDCRAFAESKWGKPSKCSYNPYITSWK